MASKVLINYPVGQTQYDIPFPYLARPFVVVTLVNSTTPTLNRVLVVGNEYRFVTPTVIEILASTDGFDIVRLQRYTSSTRIVDFKDGSPLVAKDLNVAEVQSIHIAEEGRDYVLDVTTEASQIALEAAAQAQQYRDESEVFHDDIKGDKDLVFKYKEEAWEAMLRAEMAASTANATQFILIDDLVKNIPGGNTGGADIAPTLNAALLQYKGTGMTLLGTESSRYRQDDTIIAQSNVFLDYNGAWVDDNVQHIIPASGNRPGHTFQIYGVRNFKLKNFRYNMLPTRRIQTIEGGAPPAVIWIGGQYLGDLETRTVEVSGIDGTSGTPLTGGFQLCGLGELSGLWYHDCDWSGNGWRWGCNFEYGLRPESPVLNPTFNNGRHPYNCLIERVNGRDILTCEGFYRTASCFNVSFRDCFTFNVTSAIYYYSGDRGVSRYNQKVRFSNMSCRNTNTGKPDNIVWMVIVDHDGSTGEPLPSWTNYHHNVLFENCEFWQEARAGSSCVRLAGNLGKTMFANCTFKGGFFGLWQAPSGTSAAYDAKNSLYVVSCEFDGNFQALNIVGTTGTLIHKSSFLNQPYATSVGLTAHVALTNVTNFKMTDCDLTHTSPAGSNNCPLLLVAGTNKNIVLNDNDFIVYVGKSAIVTNGPLYGRGNTITGTNAVWSNSGFRIIGALGETTTPYAFTGSGTNLSFDISAVWTFSTKVSISTITGGRDGDRMWLRGVVGAANITLKNAAVSGPTRIISKSGSDIVVTGAGAAVELMKFSDGWREM